MIKQSLGSSMVKPFTDIYKIKFDENDPVIMVQKDDGTFVELEGGKKDTHDVYDCKSTNHHFKCNIVGIIALENGGEINNKREIFLSRSDGRFTENVITIIGSIVMQTVDEGVCKEVNEKSNLF